MSETLRNNPYIDHRELNTISASGLIEGFDPNKYVIGSKSLYEKFGVSANTVYRMLLAQDGLIENGHRKLLPDFIIDMKPNKFGDLASVFIFPEFLFTSTFTDSSKTNDEKLLAELTGRQTFNIYATATGLNLVLAHLAKIRGTVSNTGGVSFFPGTKTTK